VDAVIHAPSAEWDSVSQPLLTIGLEEGRERRDAEELELLGMYAEKQDSRGYTDTYTDAH